MNNLLYTINYLNIHFLLVLQVKFLQCITAQDQRFVRGPVDREVGLAKTSLSISFSLQGLGMSPGMFVWL